MRLQLISLMAIGLVLQLLIGCRSTAATPEAQVLVGTFTNGPKEVIFNPDGTFFIIVLGQRENHGTYTIHGKQITIIDEDDRTDSCPPSQEPGVYQWTLKDDTLTFTKVNDTCTTRRIEFFTIGDWNRK